MSAPPNTARIAWIARCIWRLKRLYNGETPLPCGAPLTWAQYMRLIACVLAEYRED